MAGLGDGVQLAFDADDGGVVDMPEIVEMPEEEFRFELDDMEMFGGEGGHQVRHCSSFVWSPHLIVEERPATCLPAGDVFSTSRPMRGGRSRVAGLFLMQRSVPATPRNEVRAGASVQTQSAAEGEPELHIGQAGLNGLGLR